MAPGRKNKKSKNSRIARKTRIDRKQVPDFEDINGPDDAEIGDGLTPEEILKKKRKAESPDDKTPQKDS